MRQSKTLVIIDQRGSKSLDWRQMAIKNFVLTISDLRSSIVFTFPNAVYISGVFNGTLVARPQTQWLP